MYRTPTREVASVATDGPGCGDEFMLGGLSDLDPEVAQALKDEARRENETINLIASENYASCAVLEAQGSIMTNKYAEGYPDMSMLLRSWPSSGRKPSLTRNMSMSSHIQGHRPMRLLIWRCST